VNGWLFQSHILHAAAIPEYFVRRVTDFQQVLDIGRRLSTPGAVAEHHQRFGTIKISEAILPLGV